MIFVRGEVGETAARISDRAMAALIRKVKGDLGLACDCLTMLPRPDWVTELIRQ